MPRSQGGPTQADNLSLACPVCNSAKQAHQTARDPKSKRWVRLFNPRRDRWTRHFEWNDDFGRVKGVTAIGRATVLALHMNLPRLVRLRRAWAKLNMFPEDNQ